MMRKLFKLPIKLRKSKRGSTIIELLIAVMVVGLIVTAVANAITYSIKNTGESRFRQVATTLGQQVIEHFIGRKKTDGIVNLKNSLAQTNYCYSNITSPTDGACGATQVVNMAGTNFKRDVAIAKGGTGFHASPYFVRITVVVSWSDGASTRDVELIQELQQDSGFKD